MRPARARKPAPAPTSEPELPFPTRKPLQRVTPEEVARGSVARRPTTPAGNVKYTLTLFLRPGLAEAVTARALREGKNVPLLVAEILDREMRGAVPKAR